MSGLHLWRRVWSDEGETILVSVESTDKFDNSTLAVDCSDEKFRTSRRHFTKCGKEQQQTNH